jgi:hypothetical protein
MPEYVGRICGWDWANGEIVFTKLASQLTADKLLELIVIPVIFVVQTMVSYLVSIAVAKGFGFGKRPANFVTAMGVSLLGWVFWEKKKKANKSRYSATRIRFQFLSSSHYHKL